MALSLLTRWMPLVYRALLYPYPPDFRRRFGKEMEQVFGDRLRYAQTRGFSCLVRLGGQAGADWLVTTIREGIDSMHAQVGGATGPVFEGVPIFYMYGSSLPRTSALINGVAFSIAAFRAVN